jgi:chitodextrinase
MAGTPRNLRVARGDGTYLNLEFRQPWGIFDNFAAGDAVVNGVSIRIAPSTSSLVQSKLVDANPSTSSFSDAALGLGQSVTDPLTGVSLTTVSVGPAGAMVSIQFGSDSQAPSAPGSLSASPASSTSVQLGWTAATDNLSVAGYRVYRGGLQVGTTTALSYLDSGLEPQTPYAYEVRAYDAAGNVGPAATASATTPGADTTSPSVPNGLSATVLKGRKVRLSWSASTDNLGVAGYQVVRSSVQIASPAGTTYTHRPPKGAFMYQVRARDAAGNVSGLSPAVSVTT